MGAFPETVGRYRILRVLGRGGMGVTYEGAPIDGGPRVAIKQLQLSRMDVWKVVELFEREARVLANVTHPAVPTYIEFLPADPAGDTARFPDTTGGRWPTEVTARGSIKSHADESRFEPARRCP